ncbi:hypothetical protein PTKIN_Ptkin03bG0127300 [Pterospermum kingtungense]
MKENAMIEDVEKEKRAVRLSGGSKGRVIMEAKIMFEPENGNPGILFKKHPNMNNKLFSNENILGLKDPNRPFPTGLVEDAASVGLLKWRMQSANESMIDKNRGDKKGSCQWALEELKSACDMSISSSRSGFGSGSGFGLTNDADFLSIKSKCCQPSSAVAPCKGQSRAATLPATDPITLTIEEKLNVTLKRDGGISNFDVQGTLLLQILNQEDGIIQV